ncbi:Mediator complex subunit Med5 family protein [Saccharomyces cerevisiae]|nr:Mediator complex subunit Med5 family protein [Saccharomyces cerevisiae]
MKTLIKFVDLSRNGRNGSNGNDESSEYETINISLSFSWAILLIINLTQTYGISVVDVALKYPELSIKNSFIINFISNLPNVSDKYYLEESNVNDSDMLTKSHNTVQSWLLTLNEDSKAFHTAVLRLNAIPLLKVLRKFRVQSQSNYGIYSSDAQGDPNLEPLIAKLVAVLNVSPVYDVDPRIINSENDYSRKQLGYGKFLILNENPINKIMTNQLTHSGVSTAAHIIT